MSPRITEAIAALVAEREALQSRLGHVAAAIEALEKLESGAPKLAPRARSTAPASSGPEAVSNRPAYTRCERPDCDKTVSQPRQGRARHYCSVACGKRARKAGVTVRPETAPAPARKDVPRKDRPVDNDELDSLLARSKRGAA